MVDKPIFDIIPPEKRSGIPSKKGLPVTGPDSPYLGTYVLVGPINSPGKEESANQCVMLNMTAAPGVASALYYSLVFQLGKWGYSVMKADDWIEVSPAHAEMYQRIMAQKGELERIIKGGLVSAAEAVSHYELVKHDLRKYKEIMDYFAAKDEHTLRAMFIDNVDVHTDVQGQAPVALRSIAPRWPTIISDFMKLGDEDIDPDKIAKKLDVSKAEGVVLATKNRLYIEWKKLFSETVKERYASLKSMAEARKKTVTEYKQWLKPYITKYKIMKTAHESPAGRSGSLSSYADITGQRTFANGIRIWAWKSFKAIEARKPALERVGEFVYDPYDDYVRRNLVLNNKTGLASIYPWLLNKVPEEHFKPGVVECEADHIVQNEIKKHWIAGKHGLDPNMLYYMFFDFEIDRVGSVLPIGELEDITFTIKTYLMSQNIMLVKLLEMKCRERELEHYLDEIVGLTVEKRPVEEVIKKEYPELFGIKRELTPLQKIGEEWKALGREFKGFFAPLGKISPTPEKRGFFVKPGPYEREFRQRLSKQYLTPMGEKFATVAGFLKDKMGVG
ncbi:MAG: hypothetical protein ACE5J7_01455 [Candidatus Aenigmatarchaeota archaeon]